MRDLSNLIARVRSATGSDRRLDAEISCAFYFPDLRPAEPDDFSGAYGYTPGNIKVKHGFLMAESFTSSLAAAVALCERVLPGWHWSIRKKSSNPDFFEGMVTQAAWSYAAERFKVSHDSAPIALCLAILTAKEKANDRD